jgi:hypothetical protein
MKSLTVKFKDRGERFRVEEKVIKSNKPQKKI